MLGPDAGLPAADAPTPTTGSMPATPAANRPVGNAELIAMPAGPGFDVSLPGALIYSGLTSLGIAATGLLIVGRRRRQW
jgi:hypothetical protein